MSAGRRAWYAVVVALVRGVLWLLWKTCRVRTIHGAGYIEALRASGEPAVIAYWHQMHVFAAWYLFGEVRRGLRLGFLTSPSVSGEVPAAIIHRAGALAVRGSSTRASGDTLREMHAVLATDRRSLVVTADGPKGPLHEFKPGAVLVSKVSRVPVIPLAWAARRAIYWRSWDRFIVPLPFTEIALAIGEPYRVPREVPISDLSAACRELEQRLAVLEQQARATLGVTPDG